MKNKDIKFETLKKNYKKPIITVSIFACIIGVALTFNLTRAFYKVDKSIDLAKGTVNYKSYDFKIMAMYKSEDGSNYTEITDRMPSNGYVINESKSYCTIDNKNKDTNAILKTIAGNHIISNLAKSDKCYLYFDKYIPPISASAIVENIASISKITTPTFSNLATTDEGIYAVSDGMYGGTSYYWRGAATTNYVKFANFCWRIVRINGDGSIRLIYDGTTCHENGTSTTDSIAKTDIAFNTSDDKSYYVGWTYTARQRPSNTDSTNLGTVSTAKAELENWYSKNIDGINLEKIADGKFCNDRNVESGSSWDEAPISVNFKYAAYKRIKTDYSPTLSCPAGDTYNLKIGLINADEAMYAGGRMANNTSYYLYNGQNYWTMSPYSWNSSNGYAYMFVVRYNGSLIDYQVTYTYGLRPVINLKADTLFSSGDGTLNNPYVVQ